MKKIFGIVFLTMFLIGCTTEVETPTISESPTIDNTTVTEEIIDDETIEEFENILDELINS